MNKAKRILTTTGYTTQLEKSIVLSYIEELEQKVNHLEEKEILHLNYIDELTDRVVKLEANRDEAIEEIKDLLEHWRGNDLVERDLNTLLTILDKVGGSNE